MLCLTVLNVKKICFYLISAPASPPPPDFYIFKF